MKIFLDTANIDEIKKWVETGLIDGVTTNPSHLSKEGGDPVQQVLQICKLVPHGEISVEITESAPEDVYKQAKKIAAMAENIVVKIPCHRDYYPIIQRLSQEGIKINITLVFTLLQGLMMSKLNVRYISPFVGRLDDIDSDGIQLLVSLRDMADTYGFTTQILAASLRDVEHFHDAVVAGADAATVPAAVLEKATAHILTEQGIAAFNDAWQKLGVRNFP